MYPSPHIERYDKVDAAWLPFWGPAVVPQLLASLAFCCGLLSTVLFTSLHTSTAAQVLNTGFVSLLLYQLVRLARRQVLQGLAVLRLAPSSAETQLLRRWRAHVRTMAISLGGLNLALLLWHAASGLLILWVATVLLAAVAAAVGPSAGKSGRPGLLRYLGTLALGGLLPLDATSHPWLHIGLPVSCVALLAWTVLHLHRCLGAMPHEAHTTAKAAPWQIRLHAWWRRWTFFAQGSAQGRPHINVGIMAMIPAPATLLMPAWPSAHDPVAWKQVVVLLWMTFILTQIVACKDLHWRLWLAPKKLARQHLGWQVWRDTLHQIGLFLGLPGLLWLSVRLLLGWPVDGGMVISIGLTLLLASALAVWTVGRHLHTPSRIPLESLILTLLAGAAWFAQAHWGLPGQLDPITQALPLALALLALALWRIHAVWQRADVYALAHRPPEPTGWETD